MGVAQKNNANAGWSGRMQAKKEVAPMKILVAIDDSTFAAKVLDTAIAMAKDKAAKLVVISVAPLLDDIDDMPPGFDEKLRAGAAAAVAKAEAAAAAQGVAAQGFVAQSTSPAMTIVEYAKEIGADRLVVGHKGKSNLERLLVGSVALAVVAHAPCSVFVVK
jgi:nucleotide-binding universal stress UspA family protein